MDWWATLPWEGIGISGFVAGTWIMLSRGWFIPASTVRELTKMRDDRIAELAADRDSWRATVQTKDELIREQGAQLSELLELSRTGNALMAGIVAAAGKDSA